MMEGRQSWRVTEETGVGLIVLSSQTDRHTDRQTHGQTDTQTDRQTEFPLVDSTPSVEGVE